jgi:hypothetical protein
MRAGSYVTNVTQEPTLQRRLTLRHIRHGCDRDLGDMTTSQYQSDQTALFCITPIQVLFLNIFDRITLLSVSLPVRPGSSLRRN